MSLLKVLPRLVITLIVFSIFLLAQMDLLPLRLVERVENFFYDARVVLTMPNELDQRVVIIDLDEASLEAQGQWPWPRNTVAELVNRLFNDYGVRVLGFDVVFAEADDSSALQLVDGLINQKLITDPSSLNLFKQLRPQLDYDRVFASSLAEHAVVMGYVFKPPAAARAGVAELGQLPKPLFTQAQLEGIAIPFIEAGGYTANLAKLQQAANTGGFFDNPLVSEDGVFRRVPLMQRYRGQVYESLALAVARQALDGKQPGFSFASGKQDGLDLDALLLGEQRIAVDEQMSVLVPYRGRQGSFPYISAADVLDGSADIEALFDAIVLVGTTAPGLLDLRATPVGHKYAGVEVHANLVSGLLDGNFKSKPSFSRILEFITLLIIAVLLTALLPLLSPGWQFLLLLASISTTVLVNFWFWLERDLVLPLAAPILFTLLLFVLQSTYGYVVESRRKRRLSRLFGQYIPPELVLELDASSQELSLAGENREMTVLFTDVRGFTNISEKLPATELTELMNEFLTPITQVIHEHRGTIDKYMGDAVMAFWGAPLEQPNHAQQAVAAGLAMIQRLAGLQEAFRARGWPKIAIGVGLNSGEMNVGNMGSEFRMAYTVLGDAVNLGSRLEGLTKQYGVSFLCSEATALAASEYFYREIDQVQVKGREQPLRIYEPLCLQAEASNMLRQQVADFATALQAYREQQWPEAIIMLERLNEQQPQVLYEMYLQRITTLQSSQLDKAWSGVWAHSSK